VTQNFGPVASHNMAEISVLKTKLLLPRRSILPSMLPTTLKPKPKQTFSINSFSPDPWHTSSPGSSERSVSPLTLETQSYYMGNQLGDPKYERHPTYLQPPNYATTDAAEGTLRDTVRLL